ncbi:hypothetical protein E2C01_000068 [Portunus trituberculatus]|uniref:Uncharacterized protein n=1 Tax=Portunus trituberculatus TaxID=210409 RepID=A0A5B7CE46_PORTR|nr:hypothetical protein [Portunus trituberculatus]
MNTDFWECLSLCLVALVLEPQCVPDSLGAGGEGGAVGRTRRPASGSCYHHSSQQTLEVSQYSQEESEGTNLYEAIVQAQVVPYAVLPPLSVVPVWRGGHSVMQGVLLLPGTRWSGMVMPASVRRCSGELRMAMAIKAM